MHNAEWFKVYNFLEFILTAIQDQQDFYCEVRRFEDYLNSMMIRNSTVYRLVDKLFVPVTNEIELQEIQVLKNNASKYELSGVAEHLSASLKLISTKPKPDLRNSIKESISMVGAIARLIEPANDLGKSLSKLEQKKAISQSLASKFKSFYNYGNDKEGIRHELMDEPNLTLAEARYFLVACSAFSNYLLGTGGNQRFVC